MHLNKSRKQTKGYFIELENVDEVVFIKIKLNGHERIVYDKSEIVLFCQKMSKNLMYIPINDGVYFDPSIKSYVGSIDHALYETIEMVIYVEPTSFNKELIIHPVFLKHMKYEHGRVCIL